MPKFLDKIVSEYLYDTNFIKMTKFIRENTGPNIIVKQSIGLEEHLPWPHCSFW